MKDNEFIGLYDNALSKNTCDKIIDYFEYSFKTKPEFDKNEGKDATSKKHLSRHDYQLFLHEDDPVFRIIQNSLFNCWELYKKKYWTSNYVNIFFEEVKLQKTPPRGGFHDWHCEIVDLRDVERCVVWMLYLNDIPKGEGETEFIWQGIRVQPKAGTMLIWPAFYTHVHRGNTVYSSNKYVATGWGNYAYFDR